MLAESFHPVRLEFLGPPPDLGCTGALRFKEMPRKPVSVRPNQGLAGSQRSSSRDATFTASPITE